MNTKLQTCEANTLGTEKKTIDSGELLKVIMGFIKKSISTRRVFKEQWVLTKREQNLREQA